MDVKESLKEEVFKEMITMPESDEGFGAFWIKDIDQFDHMMLDSKATANRIVLNEKSETIRDAIRSAIKEVRLNELAKEIGVKTIDPDVPQHTFSQSY